MRPSRRIWSPWPTMAAQIRVNSVPQPTARLWKLPRAAPASIRAATCCRCHPPTETSAATRRRRSAGRTSATVAAAWMSAGWEIQVTSPNRTTFAVNQGYGARYAAQRSRVINVVVNFASPDRCRPVPDGRQRDADPHERRAGGHSQHLERPHRLAGDRQRFEHHDHVRQRLGPASTTPPSPTATGNWLSARPATPARPPISAASTATSTTTAPSTGPWTSRPSGADFNLTIGRARIAVRLQQRRHGGRGRRLSPSGPTSTGRCNSAF